MWATCLNSFYILFFADHFSNDRALVTFMISEVDSIVCVVVGDSHTQACLENLSSIIIINNNGGQLIYAPKLYFENIFFAAL